MQIANIYPNPANNKLFFPITLDKSEKLSLGIYNLVGVKVSENNLNLGVGNHIVMKNIDLSSGQYIVTISNEFGSIISSQQLVIVK